MSQSQRNIRLGTISALFVIGTVVPSTFAATGSSTVTTVIVSESGSGSGIATGSGQISNNQANVKLSQDDAVKIAQKIFPDLFSSSGSPTVSLQPGFDGSQNQVYNLNWGGMAFNPTIGPRLKSSFPMVMIDANTGQVLQFQHDKSQWTNTGNSISTVKAQEIAKTWLQKLAPNQANELFLQSGSNVPDSGFVYQFLRKVNGIIAPFDSATIRLNQSGELEMYNFSWHDATFEPVPTTLIGATDASAKYHQDLKLDLRYQTTYNSNDRELELVYQPANFNSGFFLGDATPILDAESGQLLGNDGKPMMITPSTDLSPLVPGGPTEFPKAQDKPMSQEDLEKKVSEQFSLNSDDWVLSQAQQQGNSGGPLPNHPTLNLNYMNQKTQESVNVQVDMMDGVIVNYNENPEILSNIGNNGASAVDAQAVADTFVKRLFPQLTGAIAKEQAPNGIGSPVNQKMFVYDFLVDGIPAEGFHMTVNANTGSIMYYGLMLDPSEPFPSVKNALSPEEAMTDYLAKDPVVLQYILPEEANAKVQSGFPIQYGNVAKLVYAKTPLPDGTGMLDALTGDWVSLPYGFHSSVNPPKGTTKAEKAMAELEQNGVVVGDEGNVDLSTPITHAEFIAWLSRAYNFNIGGSPSPQFSDVPADNPYASQISEALMQGWLPNTGELKPATDLTHEEAANWFVDWMSWQGPAAHIDFFKIPFTDVNAILANDRGAAVMMSTSGILPLENGKFNPKQKMTIGDAAIALVNAADVVLGNKP